MAANKMGRPTENKKDFMLRVRLDNEQVEKLSYLEMKMSLTKSEIVRLGIENIYEKEKNKSNSTVESE